MRRFWTPFIEPALKLLKPRIIVEIGADSGINTKRILEFCQATAARCHIIDPTGIRNRAECAELLAQCGVLHERRSLEVLGELGDADVYLIDGDHNWYTVYHELGAILTAARAAGRKALPVMLFHDVLWPYGRRDLYYCLTDVPAEFRQPSQVAGLLLGQSRAVPDFGINADLEHALDEGGPRNGVLTAIEDFVAENEGLYELLLVPGFHGLGMLLPRTGLPAATRKGLAALFSLSEAARGHLEAVEEDRLKASATSVQLNQALLREQAELERERQEREKLQLALAQGYAERAALAAQLQKLEQRHHLITASHSYRALSRAKRLLGHVLPEGSRREHAVHQALKTLLPSRAG